MAALLIAPAEGADDVIATLAELEGIELVRADPVADGAGPAVIAAAITSYEAQARDLAPVAGIVHGSGDRPLAAAISLAKLGIPLARLVEPGGTPGKADLPGLLADQTVSDDEKLAEQVREWLRRILTA